MYRLEIVVKLLICRDELLLHAEIVLVSEIPVLQLDSDTHDRHAFLGTTCLSPYHLAILMTILTLM